MKPTLFIFLLLSVYSLQAQENQWTWMSGDANFFQGAIYGTKGIPAAGNKPGSLYFAVNWTDSSNNLWLFGGISGGSGGGGGNTNNLWRYTPSTNLWTWMSGNGTSSPVSMYGTRGVAAPGNIPPARGGGVSWTDTNGNLWLFGGGNVNVPSGALYLNDLWKYTPSSGLWTWMSGDSIRGQSGMYGTRGVAAPGNKPGARFYSIQWNDGAGDFWLYGGQGFAANNAFGYLNDLWKYSVSTGQWTWMGGDTLPNRPVAYGTKGVAASGNDPGARERGIGWKDAAGNLWLFGELGYYAPGATGLMNDLWKYTPSTGLWTWVGGDNAINQPNVYGTKGVAAPGNKPGARYQTYSWTDATGKFWLFGGSYTTTSVVGLMSDLWRYDPLTNLWTWVNGDNIPRQLSVYGTRGVSSPNNNPGARWWGVTWTDTTGYLWMYGGYGYAPNSGPAVLGDMWRYIVPTTAAPPVAAPNATPFTIAGNPVQDNLQLSVRLPAAQKLTLQISDMNGHVLIREEHQAGQGSSRFSIPVSRLSKGSYTIRMQAGNGSYTKTFIKQ